MTVEQMVIAADYNTNPNMEAHTILAAVWKYTNTDSYRQGCNRFSTSQQVSNPTRFIAPKVYQLLAGSAQELSPEQLEVSRQNLTNQAEATAMLSRSELVSTVGNLVAQCNPPDMDGFVKRQCEGFIRNTFQPRWGRENKPRGLQQFQEVYKPHHNLNAAFTWVDRKALRSGNNMQVKKSISFVGCDVTLQATASMDCRTHNGKAMVNFKHELYEDMPDKFRVPDHASTLIMGLIAQGSRYMDREGVCCIAEYYLSEVGNELWVDCTEDTFSSGQRSVTNVEPLQAGRMVITVYNRAQINTFWHELAQPPIKVFCQVLQRCIIDLPGWQQSFFRHADDDSLGIWYERAKECVLSGQGVP